MSPELKQILENCTPQELLEASDHIKRLLTLKSGGKSIQVKTKLRSSTIKQKSVISTQAEFAITSQTYLSTLQRIFHKVYGWNIPAEAIASEKDYKKSLTAIQNFCVTQQIKSKDFETFLIFLLNLIQKTCDKKYGQDFTRFTIFKYLSTPEDVIRMHMPLILSVPGFFKSTVLEK